MSNNIYQYIFNIFESLYNSDYHLYYVSSIEHIDGKYRNRIYLRTKVPYPLRIIRNKFK